MQSSNRFQLNSYDWKKIGVGLLVAITGAALTYFSETITSIDFGAWTPIAVAAFSVLANIVRKWIAENGGER